MQDPSVSYDQIARLQNNDIARYDVFGINLDLHAVADDLRAR